MVHDYFYTECNAVDWSEHSGLTSWHLHIHTSLQLVCKYVEGKKEKWSSRLFKTISVNFKQQSFLSLLLFLPTTYLHSCFSARAKPSETPNFSHITFHKHRLVRSNSNLQTVPVSYLISSQKQYCRSSTFQRGLWLFTPSFDFREGKTIWGSLIITHLKIWRK